MARAAAASSRCVCGRVVLLFHHPALFGLECGCTDCRQACEFAAHKGGRPPPASAISRLVYLENDVSLDPPLSGEALTQALRLTMLREGGRSTRLMSRCCHSILAVDHPAYRQGVVMVPLDACIFDGETPQPLARIHMSDWDEAADGPPPPTVTPTTPVLRGDEPDIDEQAQVYRRHFRQAAELRASGQSPSVGMSLQELFSAIGDVEVLGVEQGARFRQSATP